MDNKIKIILPGGAGLVGQNLIFRLMDKGYTNIVVLDKHRNNLEKLKEIHPYVVSEYADLAERGPWVEHFVGADVVVMLQAQIGGNNSNAFERNNVLSTKLILSEMKKNEVKYLVHISSSVIESVANDDYTKTKKEQEALVIKSEINSAILRPTLMFGWFDRKHLGWLSRFMKKTPVFPIPGNGRFIRQPMYVGDFCKIIVSCIENRKIGLYNISGLEQVDYIEIIRSIKRATRSHTLVLKIPYKLFYFLIYFWGLFDKNPPFTTQQLVALTAHDIFEVIDWPKIFDIQATKFNDSVKEAFADPVYSQITLEF